MKELDIKTGPKTARSLTRLRERENKELKNEREALLPNFDHCQNNRSFIFVEDFYHELPDDGHAIIPNARRSALTTHPV